MNLKNKTWLITGGTGFLGQNLTRYILDNLKPKRIRILSRNEFNQSEMKRKLNDDRLRFLIGDVRDKNRLNYALRGVDIVIHAAALKRIEVCERDVFECLSTNIQGTRNIVEACIENNVKYCVGISSDKAPLNITLYGASKSCLEKIITHANIYNQNLKTGTKFVCVRYGNVYNSTGSVWNLWNQLIKEGKPLPLTDKRMTRFWMSIDDAIQIIMTALKNTGGGEIFIPKVQKTTMIARALQLIRDSGKKPFKEDIEIIGMRGVERLHEILISDDEVERTLDFKDYYVIKPEVIPCKLKGKKYKGGSYTSEI